MLPSSELRLWPRRPTKQRVVREEGNFAADYVVESQSQVAGMRDEFMAVRQVRQRGAAMKTAVRERSRYNPAPRSEPSGRGGLSESFALRRNSHCGDSAFRRGKSGLQRTRWWVTPTGREARDSATENKPPCGLLRKVRVKRCGKSAPAGRVTGLAR